MLHLLLFIIERVAKTFFACLTITVQQLILVYYSAPFFWQAWFMQIL